MEFLGCVKPMISMMNVPLFCDNIAIGNVIGFLFLEDVDSST